MIIRLGRKGAHGSSDDAGELGVLHRSSENLIRICCPKGALETNHANV